MCAISRNKGFTLLEILIAVALLGILSAALYGSYFGVLRARERSAEGMEARRELGATLDLLRREVASALYRTGDKHYQFVVEDRDNFGKPFSTLELTTLVPPSSAARRESGVVDVLYRMVEKDKRFILTRLERDSMLEPGKDSGYPQMEHITSFLVECHDGSTWVKSWDTALNKALPAMVRITVQVEEDGRPMEFSVLATPMMRGLK